jgi:hypothetical protein
MLGFAIAAKWKLEGQVWFWITILAALHVPVILFIPWTQLFCDQSFQLEVPVAFVFWFYKKVSGYG